MTNEDILKLAETCGFDEFVGEKDDETDGVYWQCWKEQLLKFAEAIIEEYEKDREHNLGKDEYFNSWKN